jgi:hypothetical protein
MKSMTVSLLASLTFCGTPAFADRWDPHDDSPGKTTRDLLHGADETHDLAARVSGTTLIADTDWFVMTEEPDASYEVTIDAITGELGAPSLELFDETGLLKRQTSQAVSATGGSSRTLRWTSNALQPRLVAIRVGDPTCVRCSANARYRIRAVESTLAIQRFSNVGVVSVLRLVNPRAPFCNAQVTYRSGAGILLGSDSFQVPARGTINSNTTISVNGQSGSVTIAHNCGYGGLSAQIEAITVSSNSTYAVIQDATMVPR